MMSINNESKTRHTPNNSSYSDYKRFSSDSKTDTRKQQSDFAFHKTAVSKKECTIRVKIDLASDREKRRLYNLNRKRNY